MNDEIVVDLTPEAIQLRDQMIRDTDKNIKNLMKYPGRVRKIKRLQKQIRNLLVHIRDQEAWIDHLMKRHIEDMHVISYNHKPVVKKSNKSTVYGAIILAIGTFALGLAIGSIWL